MRAKFPGGRGRRALFSALAALIILQAAPLASAAAPTNAFVEYVGCADNAFSWKKTASRRFEGFSAVRLECVSQTWRGGDWRHQILLVRPPEVRHPDIAFLFISGDGNVDAETGFLQAMAARGGAVAAIINRVPNQPLYDGRKEDALIAFTFDQFVQTGDPTWPLLLPMVKSAVRGMDAVQAAVEQEFGQKINGFVLSGASKRGWTTWLTAAADPRVKGIAPMVIDMLNMSVQTRWAQKMYGRQSERIGDYEKYDLIGRMDEPRMVELRGWVDPYSYRTRYRMPKLLLLGTNDPFWVVDSLRHYWDELPEPKLIFQTPNAGHDLAGGRESRKTLAAFFEAVAAGAELPALTWKFEPGPGVSARVEVSASAPAKAFRLWTANSAVRDFRHGRWTSVELPSNPGTHASATIDAPASGFRAYMVEAEFSTASGQTYKLSTEARVTPDSIGQLN
jgi:PhoPQ-activated pathogenicity-related protein